MRMPSSSAVTAAALSMVCLFPMISCTDVSPTGLSPDPAETGPAEAIFPSPGGVTDLTVSSVGPSSVTLTWTEVDDGTGNPADYRVKYAAPPVEWASASVTCEPSIEGVGIGRQTTCTAEGLEAASEYEFVLMSHRRVDGLWADAKYSNIASGTTSTSALPETPSGGGAASSGVWISREEVMRLPTSGPAWDQLLADAGRNPGSADIADQNSHHDVYTMAAALVCVRTGEHCDKAEKGVTDAIGTERGGRWLAVGRNLAAYVIAADLLDLRADGTPGSAGSRVQEWIEGWLTLRLSENNDASQKRPFGPFHSSANAAAQEGLAYAAVAAYLRDDALLRRAWDAFRTFVCDQSAPDRENIYLDPPVRDGWAHDEDAPCAVNPAGARKRVPSGRSGAGTIQRIDGALVGDMRRGGTYRWAPGYTQYVWVGLEGLVPAAAILDRAGFPAFEVADKAVLRTHEFLWHLRDETGEKAWFDGDRAREIVQIVNSAYGTSFPVNGATGRGRTVGYTDWTHR